MNTFRPVRATSALALLLALGACESTSSSSMDKRAPLAPVEISNEITTTAEVTGVDSASRTVTLRREDGALFQVVASEAVHNFDQIVAGDRLRIRFKESLRASLLPSGAGGPEATTGMVAVRAPKGATPAGGMAVGASVRVKIESIDRDRDIVVFSLPSGELVSHRIATPEGRKFVGSLHLGDTVELEYTQALALNIEKA
jgi:hypothetical protein